MQTASIGVALGLSSAAVAMAGAQQPAPIAFEGARLLIGDGRVIDNGIVIVENGRITRVGRVGEVQRPAGAARVDLAGKTVMPTLIDAHMHIGFENMQGWAARNYTRENVIE